MHKNILKKNTTLPSFPLTLSELIFLHSTSRVRGTSFPTMGCSDKRNCILRSGRNDVTMSKVAGNLGLGESVKSGLIWLNSGGGLLKRGRPYGEESLLQSMVRMSGVGSIVVKFVLYRTKFPKNFVSVHILKRNGIAQLSSKLFGQFREFHRSQWILADFGRIRKIRPKWI